MRWLVVLVIGCTEPYAGDLVQPDRFACLDANVDATHRSEADGPVVIVRLGNRCEHSIRVDLGAMQVVGVDDNGVRVPMTAYDPRHEIGPRSMDARAHGEKWIEFARRSRRRSARSGGHRRHRGRPPGARVHRVVP